MSQMKIWCQDCNNLIDIGDEHNCSVILSSDENSIDNSIYNENDYMERLIAIVFEKKILWNSTLPYKLRRPLETKATWLEIDTCLGVTPGTSQRKWKNLRDRFVKKHSLQNTYIPSGSAAIQKNNDWKFYESLRFLVPTINYRKTTSNIKNIQKNLASCVKQEIEQSIVTPIPSTSYNVQRRDNYSHQLTLTKSLLKPQFSQPNKNSNKQNLKNDRNSEAVSETKCSKSTLDTTPQSSGRAKRIKKSSVEDITFPLEEAILKELEQTKPIKEPDIKSEV